MRIEHDDVEGHLRVLVSSQSEGKERWTELEVVAQRDGGWDLTIAGCSALPGEWEHAKTRYCGDAQELEEALRTSQGTLSHLAQLLLKELAKVDRNFGGQEDAHSTGGK